MRRNTLVGGSDWAERFGTTALFAWWILVIGGILL